jgi:NADH:ubiquinone reductase (H+-translocating)
MRQPTAAARHILADADLSPGPARPYRHYDLGLVADLGRPQAAATPLGVHLRGGAANVVTLGYRLFAMPTINRRPRFALDWALAARRPDDVCFGSPVSAALIVNAEGLDG